jgi:hypothetical protein
MLDDGAAYVYGFGTDEETLTIAYGMSYLVSPCFRLARRVRRRYLPPRSVLFSVAWEFVALGVALLCFICKMICTVQKYMLRAFFAITP